MIVGELWRKAKNHLTAWWERKEIGRLYRWADREGIGREKVDDVITRHRGRDYDFLGDDKIRFFNVSAPLAGCKHHNMSAFFGGYIGVNDGWIMALLTANELERPQVEDAFRLMAAHERSHHVWSSFSALGFLKHRNYVNEVYADIHGAALAFPGEPERAIAAAEWLQKHANKMGRKDSHDHPSWDHRMELIREGEFTPDTIRKAIKMAGHREGWLTRRAITVYEKRQEYFETPLTVNYAEHEDKPTPEKSMPAPGIKPQVVHQVDWMAEKKERETTRDKETNEADKGIKGEAKVQTKKKRKSALNR